MLVFLHQFRFVFFFFWKLYFFVIFKTIVENTVKSIRHGVGNPRNPQGSRLRWTLAWLIRAQFSRLGFRGFGEPSSTREKKKTLSKLPYLDDYFYFVTENIVTVTKKIVKATKNDCYFNRYGSSLYRNKARIAESQICITVTVFFLKNLRAGALYDSAIA